MKKFFSFCILILIFSCDDGDIIVTSFDFDDVNLQLCEGANTNEFVFFQINTSVNEAISYNFIDSTYNETTETTAPILINLSEPDNSLIYRQFNTAITSDYYCSTIPDSNISVIEEIVISIGQASIETFIVLEDDNDGVDATDESGGIEPLEDPDDDDIPNYLDDDMADRNIGNEDGLIEEGFDNDGDDIPNFKDQDDDNDNVLTSSELVNPDPDDDDFPDRDEDGIPNYLDDDDDGDGILTRDEDIDGNGNPRDDDTDDDGTPNYLDEDDDGDGDLTIDEDTNGNGNPMDDDDDMNGIPNYLDSDLSNNMVNANIENPSILDNTVMTTFRTLLSITGIELDEGDSNSQFNEDNFSFGFRDVIISITTEKN